MVTSNRAAGRVITRNQPPARGGRRRAQPRIALFLLESKKDLLLGVARYVREHGPWRLFLQPTEAEEAMPQWLSRWEGDGIIGRITNEATAELVLGTGLPFVDVRGAVRRSEIPLIRADDEAVGRVAAEHLLERGFKHFAYYGPPGEMWSDDRRDEFASAATAVGGTCQPFERPWLVTGPTGWDQAEEELAGWLRDLPKPAGVLAASDKFGQRLLAAARRAGVKVPEEIAVVGVDDDQATCEVCDPPLSSVRLDAERHGYLAAELLDRLLSGERPPTAPILLQPAGVHTRQSTDILAIDDPVIAGAVRFIRENACAGIGVADVLREVPLSRSVLQRRFRRIFGRSTNDMIVEMRLRRAQELLIGTDLPIARIAEIAGFRYQRYLGAVFRKKVGVTPFHYRRQGGAGRSPAKA